MDIRTGNHICQNTWGMGAVTLYSVLRYFSLCTTNVRPPTSIGPLMRGLREEKTRLGGVAVRGKNKGRPGMGEQPRGRGGRGENKGGPRVGE